MTVTIYHNPSCSKSRETLALLNENGIQPNIIEYLKNPPSIETLKQILTQLGINARALLRAKEAEYKSLNLAEKQTSEEQLLQIMHQYPKLIERPIVVCEQKAVIGRPPEKVLEIIE